MATQEKISVHSLADLKNTSDDALPNYLNSLSFKQSHTLSDIRLAIGYSAFFICAVTFYWDYTLGWDATKSYTFISVVLYTLLNGLLTLWIFYVEKGSVYVGALPSGERIAISSSTIKHTPLYRLKITTWASKEAPGVTKMLVKPFAEWFDAKGGFAVKPFQEMLASNVPLIGKLDPKSVMVAKEKKKVETGVEGKSMDEKWASLLADSQIEETAAPTKAKRRVKGGK